MHERHVPVLGLRYWIALCAASIFGANMGDYFAHDLGLGHVAGLPILAIAFALILVRSRFDHTVREGYYWAAIIVIRTAATNSADFAASDMRQPRSWVMVALTLALIATLFTSWRFAWRKVVKTEEQTGVLRADSGYWMSMFLAGTLGTVAGDFFSHNLHLGDAISSLVLSACLGLLFLSDIVDCFGRCRSTG